MASLTITRYKNPEPAATVNADHSCNHQGMKHGKEEERKKSIVRNKIKSQAKQVTAKPGRVHNYRPLPVWNTLGMLSLVFESHFQNFILTQNTHIPESVLEQFITDCAIYVDRNFIINIVLSTRQILGEGLRV